jgi:DNA gyrase/topoisomerase IV subunit A
VRIFCLRPGELEALGDLLFITKMGLAKRTESAAYATRKARMAALTLKEGDALLDVQPVLHPALLCISRGAQAIQFAIEEVPRTGRAAAGVRAMTLDPGDEIAFALQTIPDEGELLLATDRGYLKKSLLLDFEPQRRGGKGLRAFTLQKNGANGSAIAGALVVREPYRFSIRQKNSPPTAFSTEDVHIEARAGKGRMYVMALMEDTVIGIEPGEG